MTPAPCAFERAREDVARAIRAHAGAGEVRAAAGGEGDVPLSVEGRAIVGHAALLVLDELVAAAADAEAPVLEHADGAVPSLLAAALEWASATIAEPSLVFAMVEDLVAASTLADCEAVFTWLESNVDAVGTYFDKGKFALLRACNDLLRRLSKDADTVLCGRVVMLLAKLYPLSERSALNVTGKFNVGNVTEFEEADGQLDGTNGEVDAHFHEAFWGLQRLFNDPMKLLGGDASTFSDFTSGVGKALDAFESLPLATPAEAGAAAGGDDADRIGAKYLTSGRLLNLQLRDGAFRRHFLCQCLIIFRFLRAPGNKKGALKPEQAKRITPVEERVLGALKRTAPGSEGARFVAAIQETLQREGSWVAWKKDGCKKSIERKPEEAPAPAPVKRRRVMRGAAPQVELSNLWKSPLGDHEAFVRSEERKPVPELGELLKPLAAELDPDAGIEEEYLLKNNKNWCWKALRLVGRSNWSDLQQATKGGVDKIVHKYVEGAPEVKPTAGEDA